MRALLAALLLLATSAASAQKISGLTELAAAPANGDLIEIVDVSDATMAASGTNKKITTANLMSYLATADAGGDTTTFPMLATAATGTLAPATDAGLSYNANTNVLTVSGSVAANVTGNLTGNADTVTAADAAGDTTTFPCVATAATGSLPCSTDAGLTYDASTNALTATTFVGALTGTASGNVADPGTPTDNAVVAFDGTTGVAIQERAITVSDVAANIVTVATTAGNGVAIESTEPAAANGASVAGKTTSVTGMDAVASLDTAGAAAGGDVTFTAGAAARFTSGNADAGDYRFIASSGIGTGLAAQVLGPANSTATNPGFSFIGDENTGMYWAGADNLGLTVGGAVKINCTTSLCRIAQAVDNGGGSTPFTMKGFVPTIEAVTTTKTPSGDEAGEHYTNTGDADGASLTATNDPTAGMFFHISLTVAQTFTITPNTGETLYMGADQCVTSMTASAIGASVTIRAASGGSGAQWHAFGASGWTCND